MRNIPWNHRRLCAIACACAMQITLPAMAGTSDDDRLRKELIESADLAGLSVSPDGGYAAVRLERAVLDRNNYQADWYLVSLRDKAAPRRIADGGDMMGSTWGIRTMAARAPVLRAQWAVDGRSFVYLKRRKESTQVWQYQPASGLDRQLSTEKSDVREVRWATDGKSLLLLLAPDDAQSYRDMHAQEAANGVLFDSKRFTLFHGLLSNAPPGAFEPRTEQGSDIVVLDPRSPRTRAATAAEIEQFHLADRRHVRAANKNTPVTTDDGAMPSAAQLAARFPLFGQPEFARVGESRISGRQIAWAQAADPEMRGGAAPQVLFAATGPGTAPVRCSVAECTGRVTGLAWLGTGQLVFVRRDGTGNTRYGIFIWDVAQNSVRKVWQSDQYLEACDLTGRRLVCIHEAASVAPQLVSIDLDSGELRPLFQPNADLSRQLPAAVRVEWSTAKGENAVGYFLQAESTAPGKPAPVVVVQYTALGFLKGGSGDEWPVALFVRNGISVFVVNRLDNMAVSAKYAQPEANDRLFDKLEYRWMPLRAIESGLDHLQQKGLIDPDRIGLTGFSDGNATASFVLIHSRRFAAASMASAGEDPGTYFLSPERFRQEIVRRGADPQHADRNFYYRNTTMGTSAASIVTPILVQAADREILATMQSYSALKDAARPVEMHLFYDEYHWKWQPRHRAVVYQRNVDWFRYWLQDYEDPAAAKAGQYKRWRELRGQRDAALPVAEPPLPVPDWANGEMGDEAWFNARMAKQP